MRNLKYLIFFLCLLVSTPLIQAQNIDFGKEKINLIIDRTLFVCGDEINFMAQIENNYNQSNVLYMELILPDGNALVSQKHQIVNKTVYGKLIIDHGLESGTYYLKAYTKYLRNFGPSAFTYYPIKIVNPTSDKFRSGMDSNVFENITNTEIPKISAKKIDNKHIAVHLNDAQFRNSENAVISIIPENTFLFSNFKSKADTINRQNYYPESRGISLSGLLVDSSNNLPLAFKEITLSIIDQRNFIPNLTNREGKFYFALPDIEGNTEVFISTKKETGIRPKILVDRDYDSEPVSLPDPPFYLTHEERSAALKLAQNIQIEELFYTRNTIQKLDTFFIPFYGKANNTLYLDNYINMETLEEYFTELPGLVRIKTTKGEKNFSIYSTIGEMNIFPPLVLIDWVAVEDNNRILAVSPKGIERVEIIPYPYVYGGFSYGGIISIRTRKGDFGGISLPKTGSFFSFDFYVAQDERKSLEDINHLPNTQNTLYLKNHPIKNNESIVIELSTTVDLKNYWLLVQAMTDNGEIKKEVFSFVLNQ